MDVSLEEIINEYPDFLKQQLKCYFTDEQKDGLLKKMISLSDRFEHHKFSEFTVKCNKDCYNGVSNLRESCDNLLKKETSYGQTLDNLADRCASAILDFRYMQEFEKRYENLNEDSAEIGMIVKDLHKMLNREFLYKRSGTRKIFKVVSSNMALPFALITGKSVNKKIDLHYAEIVGVRAGEALPFLQYRSTVEVPDLNCPDKTFYTYMMALPNGQTLACRMPFGFKNTEFKMDESAVYQAFVIESKITGKLHGSFINQSGDPKSPCFEMHPKVIEYNKRIK